MNIIATPIGTGIFDTMFNIVQEFPFGPDTGQMPSGLLVRSLMGREMRATAITPINKFRPHAHFTNWNHHINLLKKSLYVLILYYEPVLDEENSVCAEHMPGYKPV
jgi:hypothetical protein